MKLLVSVGSRKGFGKPAAVCDVTMQLALAGDSLFGRSLRRRQEVVAFHDRSHCLYTQGRGVVQKEKREEKVTGFYLFVHPDTVSQLQKAEHTEHAWKVLRFTKWEASVLTHIFVKNVLCYC